MATPTRFRKTTRSRAGAEESLLRAPGTYIFFGMFGGLRYYPPRAVARSGRRRVLVGVHRAVALRRSARCPRFILPSRRRRTSLAKAIERRFPSSCRATTRALNPENWATRTRKRVRPLRARRREPPPVPTQRRVAHKEVCSWHLQVPRTERTSTRDMLSSERSSGLTLLSYQQTRIAC